MFAVIKNLLKYSSNHMIENHLIHTINKDVVKDYPLKDIQGAVSEKIFYYSPRWNFYHTCRQLAKLLPDDKAIIVAHDWLELGMASNLGLQNPVVQIVHGNYDYYYNLAIKHSSVVNLFICISNKIFGSLKRKLPGRQFDIVHLNFPVPEATSARQIKKALHLIYYPGNLRDANKQFATIIEIAAKLTGNANDYFFTIAGDGMTTQEFFDVWPAAMKDRVNFTGLQTSEQIIALLPGHDIFLLPSLKEGLPVSLAEAMKIGAVPLITNWDGGADELVTEGITGYFFKPSASTEYVKCIKMLNADRQLLKTLSDNCKLTANSLFDPVTNTKKFENLYLELFSKKTGEKKPVKVYGSRLDHPLIPNIITSSIRSKK